MEKLIVIGLDGATFDLIKPWADDGHLPVLKGLLDTGSSGYLKSTFPPLTGPAWSSFMTGKSPGHHGVFEFFYRAPGTYKQSLHNRLTIQGKTLWKQLSDYGKNVGVMGVPLTYPPEEVNGFTITGLLTPPNSKNFTFPLSLRKELERKLGKYMIRQDEKYRPSNPGLFINEQYEILENNIQASIYLLQNKKWDFMMLHFLGTDRISHEFWHNHDETHPQHNPEERARLGNVIQDFYKAVDTGLGKILDVIDDDTSVIIMSDHGFGRVKKFINVNVWLLENGYMKLKRNIFTWLRYFIFKMGFNYDVLGRFIIKAGFGKQAKKLGRAKRENLQRKVFLSLDDVDWSRTVAYSMGNFGQIFLNLAGREPKGIVETGEPSQQLLVDLSANLKKLTDPETNEPVIDQIFFPNDIYSGPHIAKAPDLMFRTIGMEYKVMGLSDFSSPKVFEPVFGTTGHHRMEGIFIASGNNFKKGVWLENLRIEDLAPTILYLLEQPIPSDMDGKIIFDLFEPTFTKNHPPQYSEEDGSDQNDQNPLSKKEEQLIAERLRDLGYVT